MLSHCKSNRSLNHCIIWVNAFVLSIIRLCIHIIFGKMLCKLSAYSEYCGQRLYSIMYINIDFVSYSTKWKKIQHTFVLNNNNNTGCFVNFLFLRVDLFGVVLIFVFSLHSPSARILAHILPRNNNTRLEYTHFVCCLFQTFIQH